MACAAVRLVACAVVLFCALGAATSDDSFSEELLLKPLPDGSLLAHLLFTTTWDVNSTDPFAMQHYGRFPKTMGDVVRAFAVEQLELSFTQGRWEHHVWGPPVIDAPHGALLAAGFKDATGAEGNWRKLRNSLSGLFCASLNGLDETLTSNPWFSFQGLLGAAFEEELQAERDEDELQAFLHREVDEVLAKEGDTLSDYLARNGIFEPTPIDLRRFENAQRLAANSRRAQAASGASAGTLGSAIRMGHLPAEAVCTENLTPFVKLLPSRDESGLGRLLNPLALYDVLFFSQTSQFRYAEADACRGAEACDVSRLELVQSLAVVFNTRNKESFSLSKLFRVKDPLQASKLANGGSRVWLATAEGSDLTVEPAPRQHTGGMGYYDLTEGANMDLFFSANKRGGPGESVDVLVRKELLGVGEERGRVVLDITNKADEERSVAVLEQMQWFLPVYLHTLEFFQNGFSQDIAEACTAWRLEPGADHSVPTVMELKMTLPARSHTVITYEFEKGYIHWTEHPPDAHRGADVPAACVTVFYDEQPESLSLSGVEWGLGALDDEERARKYALQPFERRIYSDSLLVSLPLPDFSMPYNVITLTCTMFGAVFSAILAATTRRHGYLRHGGDYQSTRFSTWLYRKVRDYFTK